MVILQQILTGNAKLPRVAKARSMGILSVGDATTFAEQEGMIQLDMEGCRTRIRINLAAAKAASLSISSKLPGLAEIVDP